MEGWKALPVLWLMNTIKDAYITDKHQGDLMSRKMPRTHIRERIASSISNAGRIGYPQAEV
jgi:hypothetical protein